MSISTIQNFFKETITRAVTLTGATNIYVSALPTPDEGYVVISPSSSSLREIVYYTAKGTDSNGTYLTVTLANRGLGGTTAQPHAIGEPVRMNVTAEHIKEISDALDQIVAGGAQDASTTTKGIVKISSAPSVATNPIALNIEEVDETGASKVVRIKDTGLLDTTIIPVEAIRIVDSGYSLSDTVLNSNDAPVSIEGAQTYKKVKETQINSYVNQIRVKCDVSGSSVNKYLKAYLNGNPISGDVENISMNYDWSTAIKPGDLIQIYARQSPGLYATVSNFRICGTLANKRIYSIGNSQLVSPIEINETSTIPFSAVNNM